MIVKGDKRHNILIIETGVQDSGSELHVKVVCILISAVLIGFILKSSSIVAGLVIFGPLLTLFVFLSLPNAWFAEKILIDRHNDKLSKSSRGLSLRRWKIRYFNEFSAILIVEDKVHSISLGIGSRYQMFFVLEPKMQKRRVLFVDELLSAEDAAKAAREIHDYTGWAIEFLSLERTIEENDVHWEEW